MANEINRDKVASLPAKRLTTATTTHPSTAQRAKALGDLIVKFRLTNGWNLLPPGDQLAMTAAWLEVLDISGVPADQYGACYSSAMQARAERKASGEQLSHLTADELAAEWLKIKRFNDEMQREEMKHRLLCEVNPKSCERCFGTGLEELPGQPPRPGCEHRPLSDEERAERDREKAEHLAWLREQGRKVGTPKPPVKEVPPAPPGYWMRCDSCGRRQDFTRKSDGDRCGKLLDAHTDPRMCEGTMRAEEK